MTRTIIVALLLIAFTSTTASAKLKIPLGKREVLNKVHDLPDTDDFKTKEGNFIDLATLHEEFNIAYILPLYITKEPRLVGYDKGTDSYYDIPESELDAIIASEKLDKEKLLKLPFYTKYGGKLVAALIVAFLIWGLIPSKKEEVEPTNV